MANHTEELNTNFNFPHIDIINRLRDGVLTGYQARSHSGYVMYDTTANDTELAPDTMEETPVTYYYTLRGFPASFNFDNFTWVAVPESSVDENYIFGTVNNGNHEIM